MQKRRGAVGGDIVFSGLAPSVLEVFRISSFDKLFRVVSTRDQFISSSRAETTPSEIITTETVNDLLDKFADLRKSEKLTDEMIEQLRREYV